MFLRSLREIEIDPTLGVSQNSALSAGIFLVGLLIFEGTYFGSGVFQEIQSAIQNNGVGYWIISSGYILTGLYLFFLLLLCAYAGTVCVRLVGLLVFVLITIVEYSYHSALGRFSISFDINAAQTATSDQFWSLLTSHVSFIWIIPSAGLIFLTGIFRDARKPLGFKVFMTWFVALIVFYVQMFFFQPILLGSQPPNNSFDAFFQTITNYIVSERMGTIDPHPREKLQFAAARNYHPNNNIVLIFDESVRADHLSINGYARETTPYLSELAKGNLLVNWGIASSASTSSEPSYESFIVGAFSRNVGPAGREINNMPTIFQYAKAMNYRTIMIDGQVSEYWGGTTDDKNYIDQFVPVTDLQRSTRTNQDSPNEAWSIDGAIARSVRALISESSNNFIFVYKRGNHYPYDRNYPSEEARWEPVYRPSSILSTPTENDKEALINSYDNAIGFNLDGFFKTLADDYSHLPNGTVIFYTSDHGEAFNINGRAPHGGSSREEAMVPLFALGIHDLAIDVKFRASHANLFTALLDLMQYPKDERKYPYQMSLFTSKSADSALRFFRLPDGRTIPFD